LKNLGFLGEIFQTKPFMADPTQATKKLIRTHHYSKVIDFKLFDFRHHNPYSLTESSPLLITK